MELSHLDKEGNARMVNISNKEKTNRVAVAECFITMNSQTLNAIKNNDVPKGDVFTVSKVAGIQAAKKTYDLIPMCHNINLSGVDISFDFIENGVKITSTCYANDCTGVEMEALVSCSVSALTIYDMAKAIDKTMVISGVKLLEKSGGKSGHFVR